MMLFRCLCVALLLARDGFVLLGLADTGQIDQYDAFSSSVRWHLFLILFFSMERVVWCGVVWWWWW